MNKIKFITYTLALLLSSSFFISCEDDETGTPEINVIYSSDNTLSDNSGYPNSSVIAEGVNIDDLKTIVFDGQIEVIFNPALNSDVGIVFQVPFDEANGSRFGVQDITFTNKSGKIVTSQFNILQPEPTIKSKDAFSPERPTIGTQVIVSGEWFFDVTSVTFKGEEMDYDVLTSSKISFTVPEDATSGGEVVVETIIGPSEPQFMEIYLGFDVFLTTNFDGEGFRPDSNWTSYGDIADFGYSDVDGIDGNYAYLSWEGATANGYNGTQSSTAGGTMIEETNPDKVKFVMDYNGDGYIGSIVDIYIVDGEVNWAYTFTIMQEGWQTLEALVSDFGKDYNMANQSNGDADPSKINQIKVTLNQGAGTPNPSQVKFDNLRWYVYESAQEGINGPQNLLANGNLEAGEGDEFENWGKWNGGDRMTAETNDVYQGARALKVVNPSAGNEWDTQFVSDAAITEVGGTYTVTFWIKGDEGTVRVSTAADAGNQYGPNLTVSSEWQQYSWEITANDVATRIILDMGSSAATYIVDDIKLIAN